MNTIFTVGMERIVYLVNFHTETHPIRYRYLKLLIYSMVTYIPLLPLREGEMTICSPEACDTA